MWLWYASRATGLVALVLLTAVMLLGIVGPARVGTPGWPQFVLQLLHRNLALLVLAFLAVHVGSAVVDGYVDLEWTDAVIPFFAQYEPFWTGLGAVALDLVLALVLTSLLRTRLGLRAWRVVHWSAYACWPIAVAHGLGAGDADTTSGLVPAVTVVCVVAVVVAFGATVPRRARDRRVPPLPAGRR